MKKLYEVNYKYYAEVEKNATKIYTDAFLSNFFDNDAKRLELEIGDKTFNAENKTYKNFLRARLWYIDHCNVTTFDSKSAADKYACSVVSDSVKDYMDAQSFLKKITELKRCYTVQERLNSSMDKTSSSFSCEPRGYDGAVMFFRRYLWSDS